MTLLGSDDIVLGTRRLQVVGNKQMKFSALRQLWV